MSLRSARPRIVRSAKPGGSTMTLAQTSTPLGHVLAGEAMHPGILGVPAESPLRFLARTMAVQRVHAVALMDGAARSTSVSVVDALALVRAIAGGGLRPTPEAMPVVDVSDPLAIAGSH